MSALKNKMAFFFQLGVLSIFSFYFTSCESDSRGLTSEEKEIIKKEISDVGKGVLASVNRLDLESALKPYLNSPDFLMINPDGSFGDYSTMKSMNTAAFKQMTALKQTTIKEDFRFITPTQVLYTWFGKNEIQLKTGEKIKNESYIGSMLFSKIKNEWKIIYAHESASPPIIEKSPQ